MTDETDPGLPEAPPVAPPTTETVISKTTTEKQTSGAPKPEESMLAGLSGRFWVAMVFAIGMVLAMLLLMAALIMGKFPTDATTVTALVGLVAGFFSTASTLVGMYIGQGQKPKSQAQ